jgi:sigma-B regulation protein RsbU (phosphoserine phosphatase)
MKWPIFPPPWFSGFSVVSGIVLLFLMIFMFLRYRRLRRANLALLREKEVMFAFVHDVGEVFAESEDVDVEPLLERALYYALRTTRASAGMVYLFEPGGDWLRVRAVAGTLCPPLAGPAPEIFNASADKTEVLKQAVREQLARKGSGLVGETAERGQGLLIEDAERDPRVPAHAHEWLKIRSLIGVPMRFRQKTLGVMFIVNPVDLRPFVAADLNLLQALADQASVSMHFALLREELDAKRRMDHDIGIARRIQKTLLPRELPRIPSADIAAFSLPALQIGGDYYDVIRVDEDHWGIVIADVSGKGVSGALLMSVCRSVMRAQAPGCVRPGEVLNSLCRVLAPDLAEDMFVTVLYMIYNARTRELRVARAGHERPIWCHAADGRVERIDSGGAAIGMVPPELFTRALRETSVTLAPGDSVTLYTDGITEAVNDRDEEWGVPRLCETVQASSAFTAAEVLMSVQQRVVRFSSGTSQRDDMTMTCLRVRRSETPG